MNAPDPGAWVAAFAGGAIAVGALSTYVGLGIASPATIYLSVWTAVVAIACFTGRDYLPVADATWETVAFASLALVLGCVLGVLVADRASYRSRRRWYDESLMNRLYWAAVLAMAVYVAIQVYRALPLLNAAGGLRAVFGGQGIEFRQLQVETAARNASEALEGGSLALALVGYVLFLGTISVFWAGDFAVRGKWLHAFAPLLILAAFSVLTLQRFTFVYSFLLFLFSYRYHRRLSPRAPASPWPLWGLVGVAVAVVILPLVFRGQANTGGQQFDSVLDYIAGGFGGLNQVTVDHTTFAGPHPGYGVWTAWGGASIVSRLGVDLNLPDNTFPFLDIAQTRDVYNNVFTYLIYPLYDFGRLGLVFLPLGLGFVSSLLDRMVVAKSRIEFIPLACIAMTTITMSFFGLSLVRDVRWLFLAAASVPLGGFITAAPRRPGKHAVAASRGLTAHS